MREEELESFKEYMGKSPLNNITELENELKEILRKNPTLEAILIKNKQLQSQLQSYKAKEDKLREYIDKEENDGYCSTPTKKYWVQDIEQILNEGDK